RRRSQPKSLERQSPAKRRPVYSQWSVVSWLPESCSWEVCRAGVTLKFQNHTVGKGRSFSIYHFPFLIFHLLDQLVSSARYEQTTKWRMKNEKWKMIYGK